MARIRYQPATKTKGFQPIQLTTAGISRMREETNRVVQGMEKNLAAEQRQRQENLKAMQDNAAYTEQITKENRAIEVQNLKNEQLSITQTAQRDQQQAQYDADAAETILSSLAGFSTTIAKTAADRTAKQLEDQTDAANAVPLAPLLVMDAGQYETAFSTLGKAAQIESTAAKIEGAESGESFAETYKRLASNAGLGAVGKRVLDNRLYEAKHGIYTNRAFASDEKKYEINGKKFSGLEALNDSQMTAVVQAQVTRDLTRDMRETLGIAEPLYFTPGKTAVEKKDALQLARSDARSIEQSQSMMLDNANVLLSSYNANNASNAYSQIVDATRSYGKANTSMVNAMKMASTKEEAQAIRNAIIIGQNGKATTWGERYSKLADQAELGRVDRINARNRENRRIRKETLDNNLYEAREPILQRLNENPEEIYEQVTEEYYAQGATPPSWFKEAYRSSITGANGKFAEELAQLQRTGGVVSAERVNAERNLTNREKLVNLRSAQIEQQYGGQAGLDQLKGLEALARNRTNIAPNGGRNSPITYTLLAGMEKRWKEHFAATQDVVKATELLEADLFEADKKENPNALFAAKYDNDGNALSYPNLSSTDLDTDQRLTLLQTKLTAKRSLGEIVNMPSMLGEPSDLAAISVQSETSNDIKFTRETMYLAAKFGKKPSEIHNAQVTANNKAYGTNTPLINPTIKSEAIDNANPADAKLMNSIFKAQNNRGAANYTGTANRPENMRSTFRNTPAGQISGNGYGDTDGQDTGTNIELYGPQGFTRKIADHQSATGAYGGRGVPISFPYELTFNEFIPGGRNAGGRAITTQGSTDRVVKGTAPGGFGHIGSYTYTDENGDQYEIMLAHGDQPFNAFNEGQTIPAGTVLGYQGASGSSDDGAGGGYDHISFHVNSYGNGDPNRIIRQFTESLINQN